MAASFQNTGISYQILMETLRNLIVVNPKPGTIIFIPMSKNVGTSYSLYCQIAQNCKTKAAKTKINFQIAKTRL